MNTEIDNPRLPFPVYRDSRGLPFSTQGGCGGCWHREGKRCFNDKLVEIPTEQTGEGERKYARRLGNEVTDAHYLLCKERQGYANSRNVMMCGLSGIPPFGNDYGGGLTVKQLEAAIERQKQDAAREAEEAATPKPKNRRWICTVCDREWYTVATDPVPDRSPCCRRGYEEIEEDDES